ncbi:peptide ABC transporter substrate-binding protein [Vineibacter terrae]|uniref:Peptide ABC transporter substrate-binding protein n=1 Tax=Vineibacter terrae TaxID=2586908 RepID=A0A5C8PVU2_9HYPH|nr:ABC transporter substrate-binding protein [Vineibacter terrae]TXL82337.1 peptide ABC transporter substrate-binding protein [Vineibacter terrae]
MRTALAAVAAAFLSAVAGLAGPALAQKHGGTLRIYHRDMPASASIHEEATVSTNMPFMAVFNNLVFFDPDVKINSPEKLVGELATSWAWNADNTRLTFQLRQGVKWHDGKPFTSKDVVCTWSTLSGLTAPEKGGDMRKNPRKVWYQNLKEITTKGDYEVTFVLGRPQPSFIAMLAAGYSPVYPCHVPAREMRTKPIGTGPFKFVEMRRNESIRLVRNPDYWKPGRPYLDAIDWKIIDNRSTRVLAFIAGEFDLTFDSDITFPLLKDVRSQAPKAVCEARPTNVSNNLIVNRDAAPFNNPKIRLAMAMALDRKTFVDILSQGNDKIGAAMLPGPEGVWAMPADMLATLPGYGPDTEKNQAAARKIMEELGYSDANPLKVKVATRNIAVYRDPAVLLIDQLKKIHIAGELDAVDTAVWFSKIARKDYQVGLNLTGLGVDDPDVNFYENYSCGSERNYTGYCNKEVDALIDAQSREADREKRKKMVWEVERKLVEDVARPIISHNVANTCWQPHLKGLVLQSNSIYNGWRFEGVWLDK